MSSSQLSGQSSILHVANYGGAYSGNFMASLNALEKRLQGFDIRQIVGLPERIQDFEWVKAGSAPNGSLRILHDSRGWGVFAREVSTIARAENSLILHAHFGYDIPVWLASLPGRLSGRRIRVVWHFHSFPESDRGIRRLVKDLVKLRVMGQSVRVITVSDETRESLVERGLRRDHISTIYNAIDLGRATALRSDPRSLRSALGIAQGQKVVLSFAWNAYVKGIDLLVEAMPQVWQAHPNVRLLLVGGDPLREFLAVRYNGALPEWLVVAEPVENVADLYGVADVFVAASRGEGFPYSVGEAMANRVPTVLSEIPGHDWAISQCIAIGFQSGSIPELAAALERVLSNTLDQVATQTEAAADFVAHSLSMEAWTESVCRVYRDLEPALFDQKAAA